MDAQAQPVVKDLPGFSIAGLSMDCRINDVSGIPGLWEKFFPFMKQHFMDAPVAWGVCLNNDDPDGFKYICGCVWEDSEAPEGLELFEIPACSYVVYQFNDLPKEINPFWSANYKKLCEAAGREFREDGPWLEEYPYDCMDEATGKVRCSLYTPVK